MHFPYIANNNYKLIFWFEIITMKFNFEQENLYKYLTVCFWHINTSNGKVRVIIFYRLSIFINVRTFKQLIFYCFIYSSISKVMSENARERTLAKFTAYAMLHVAESNC